MLRIRFEVVPGGIERLAYPVDELTIACRFPLSTEAQDFHVIHHGQYATMEQHVPTDDPDCWLDLMRAALSALAERSLTLTGAEVFPGALSLDPAEFADEMRRLVDARGDVIHSVWLFGRRARGEDFSEAAFWAKVDALPKKFDGRPAINGDWLAEHWPGYVAWDVDVRLVKKCYQTGPMTTDGVSYPSLGHVLEDVISAGFGLRPCPGDRADAPLMCGNGILFAFERPGGELGTYLTRDTFRASKWSTAGKVPDEKRDPKFTRELRHEISRGHVLFDEAGGLRKYIDRPANGGAEARALAPLASFGAAMPALVSDSGALGT